MLIVASGLHTLNIRNGNGWDYNTVTGDKDYRANTAANAIGAVAGVLTGTFILSTGYNLIRDVASNVLVDSVSLYFASKEKISRLNRKTGDVIWSIPFPDDLPAKSNLLFTDSMILMVNNGYAYLGYRMMDYGKPFIAAFDRETGNQKFFSVFNTKDDPIIGFRIIGTELFLLFKHRLEKYALASGTLIMNKDFSAEEAGEL